MADEIVNKFFASNNIKWVGYILMAIGVIFLIKGFMSNKNVGASADVGDKIEASNNVNYVSNGFIVFGIGLLIIATIKK